MSSSALTPMWTPLISESAEPTQWSLYINHYSESSSRIHRSCTGVKASFKVGLKGGLTWGMSHSPRWPPFHPPLKLALTPVQDLWIPLQNCSWPTLLVVQIISAFYVWITVKLKDLMLCRYGKVIHSVCSDREWSVIEFLICSMSSQIWPNGQVCSLKVKKIW